MYVAGKYENVSLKFELTLLDKFYSRTEKYDNLRLYLYLLFLLNFFINVGVLTYTYSLFYACFESILLLFFLIIFQDSLFTKFTMTITCYKTIRWDFQFHYIPCFVISFTSFFLHMGILYIY